MGLINIKDLGIFINMIRMLTIANEEIYSDMMDRIK